MDRTIRFPTGPVPSWEGIRTQLGSVGEQASLRMIDGLPAFPDETPEETWKELRVGLAAGMITVRRSAADALSCVVWGNAEGALRSAWDKLCWACAVAGDGRVDTPAGAVSADDFARTVGISPP